MREIKFRAIKDQMSFEFAYGDGICYSPSSMPRIPDKNGMLYTCLKGTEGQYTGLKDKNGVEIYEGDIVKYTQHINGNYVDERTEMQEVIFMNGAFQLLDVKGREYKQYTTRIHSDVEVIGNIHQNPELLQ